MHKPQINHGDQGIADLDNLTNATDADLSTRISSLSEHPRLHGPGSSRKDDKSQWASIKFMGSLHPCPFHTQAVPSISPTLLSEWVQLGAVVTMAGLLLAEFRGLRSDFKEELRAIEARREKQIADFRDELKQELRVSGTREGKQMVDFRDDIKEPITEFRDEFKEELMASEARKEKKWTN